MPGSQRRGPGGTWPRSRTAQRAGRTRPTGSASRVVQLVPVAGTAQGVDQQVVVGPAKSWVEFRAGNRLQGGSPVEGGTCGVRPECRSPSRRSPHRDTIAAGDRPWARRRRPPAPRRPRPASDRTRHRASAMPRVAADAPEALPAAAGRGDRPDKSAARGGRMARIRPSGPRTGARPGRPGPPPTPACGTTGGTALSPLRNRRTPPGPAIDRRASGGLRGRPRSGSVPSQPPPDIPPAGRPASPGRPRSRNRSARPVETSQIKPKRFRGSMTRDQLARLAPARIHGRSCRGFARTGRGSRPPV